MSPAARRYWLLRAYIASRALVVVLLTLLDPNTLNRRAVDGSGPLGWYAVSALGVVALIALFDVLVNDLLPEKFTLPSFMRNRHLIYMALAMGCAGMSFVVFRTGGWTPIMFVYWLDALAATAVAILDLLARYHPDRRTGERRHDHRRSGERRSFSA